MALQEHLTPGDEDYLVRVNEHVTRREREDGRIPKVGGFAARAGLVPIAKGGDHEEMKTEEEHGLDSPEGHLRGRERASRSSAFVYASFECNHFRRS